MREDFLHYIWQYQKIKTTCLKTVQGSDLQVIAIGDYNTNSGPDFFNARIILDGQKWAGNIEVHLKSSDWYVHQHQNDDAYKNVILHVVWDDDIAVFDANQNLVETLVLKDVVDEDLVKQYKELLRKKKWINCENKIATIDNFALSFWKEKLLIKRLQRKSEEFQEVLDKTRNDWEALLFLLLAKNFGLKINAEYFTQIASNVSFEVFKKEVSNVLCLESLLFGQANLLENDIEDEYYNRLKNEYRFLKRKYQLNDLLVKLNFFRLRPISFPTIRLSQFAVLYHTHTNLFSKIIETKDVSDIYNLFTISASPYWNTHYTFRKESAKREKRLSKSFIDLLIINTIIPVKFMFSKSLGKENFEDLFELYNSLKPEKNGVIEKFKELKITVKSANDSQSLIELKTNYCDYNKCLQCEIGNKLLYAK